MCDAFICDGIRIPTGRHGGALTGVRADDLAAIPSYELLNCNPRLDPGVIDDVISGCANQADEDNRNVAHMATLPADYPHSVAGTTVNRPCGSGLGAVGFVARTTKVSDANLLIAGGTESMSCTPSVVGKATVSFQCQVEIFDTTIGWHSVNPLMQQQFGTDSMPEVAENVAELLSISREDRDAFAYRSQQYTVRAQCDDILAQEVVPVQIVSKKGVVSTVRGDEHPHTETTLEQLAQLKTLFRKNGVVIAGNASRVNNGVVVMIVASEQHIEAQGLTPRARTVAIATAGVEPECMSLGPVPAVRKVLEYVGLNINDMDVIELNEVFAARALGVIRQLGLAGDAEHMNPSGGVIALGHPLGMSGVWLVPAATLELERRDGCYALCTMCIGVGQDITIIPG